MIRLAWALLPAVAIAAERPAVIRVGDVGITAGALSARARELQGAGTEFKPDQLIEGLVDEAILAIDARRSGTAGTPDAQAAIAVETSRVLARHVVDHQISAGVQPAEEAVRALFHQGADTADLELLILSTREEASAARSRLEAGGEFALEAARSLDPRSSRNRGITGPLSRIQMDARLAESAFSEPEGRLFGPVALANGWAVARVRTRTIGSDALYKTRRDALLPMARQQAIGRAKAHLVANLRKKFAATVKEAVLEGTGKRVDATEAEANLVIATVGGTEIRLRELLPSLRRLAGGRGSSHMLGPSVKVQLAWSLVDDRLIALEARAQGFDKAPEIPDLLAAAEIQALAATQAVRLRTEAALKDPTAPRRDVVRERIASLRKGIDVRVDRAAARAAANAAVGSASR